MVLQPRPIAFTLAVIGFFVLSVVGTVVGLAPDTCCVRAVGGALVVYLAASMAVRAISTILTQAMIASQLREDTPSDNKN